MRTSSFSAKCRRLAPALLLLAGGYAVAQAAAPLTVTPLQLQFPTAQVGSSSAPATATITNRSGNTVTGLALSLSGDYSNLTTCGTSLAAGASCQVAITFAPTTAGLRNGTLAVTYSGQAAPASATLSAMAYALTSIAISPQTVSIPMGAARPIYATGSYSDGSVQDISSAVVWTSSDPGTVSVTNAGVATGLVVGSAMLTATWGNTTANVTVNVTTATLVSLAVDSIRLSLPQGYAQQFNAIGTYSDGTQLVVTNQAAWTSSVGSVAAVSSNGMVATRAPGTALISATLGGISSAAPLTVTSATLKSVAITPANITMAAGTILQLQVNGTYSDGSTRNLTTLASWSSSAANTASVNANGRITSGALPGAASISATFAGLTAQASTTVTSAVLKKILVTPGSSSLPAAATQTFTAKGKFSDGSVQDVSLLVHWTSSAAAILTVANTTGSEGIANAMASGNATVTASYLPSVSATSPVTVNTAKLVSLSISPANTTAAAGRSLHLKATGTFSDQTTHNLTQAVTWSASNPAMLFVSNVLYSQGFGCGLSSGQTSVTATLGSVTGSTLLTVASPALISINVTPAAAAVAAGNTQQFTALGTYGNGSTQDLTATATWSSAPASAATVSDTPGTDGLAQGVAPGQATVTATLGTVSGSGQLTVGAAQLVSISITPANQTITAGASQQFAAMGTYTDGSMQDVTAASTWSASPPNGATVGNSPGSAGLIVGLTAGQLTITAASGAISGNTLLTVSPAAPVLTSISVLPSNGTVLTGSTHQFTATGTYSDGSSHDVTTTVNWSATPTTVVNIGNSPGNQGVAQALTTGSATVTAASGQVTAQAQLSVVALLTGITVSPSTASLLMGGNQQFTATGTYSDGSTQDLTATATWSSSQSAVLTVGNAPGTPGFAQAIANGSATVTASYSSNIASATVSVGPTLTSISVSPANPTLGTTSSQQFTATGTYSDSSTLDITNQVTWSATPASVITISPSGLAHTLVIGQGSVTATLGALSNSTGVTVIFEPPTLISLAVSPFSPTVEVGGSLQLYATGTYSDGSTQDLTATATWISSNPAVVPFNTPGLASALSVGATTVSASVGTLAAPAIPFSVVPVPVVPNFCASAPTGLPDLPPTTVLPALPQSCTVPTYPNYTSTVTVNSFSALQTAVNTAACGTRIVLAAGVQYVGNLQIPGTNCLDNPILLENSAIAAMPQWLVPSRSLAGTSAVPTLASPNAVPALQVLDNAAGWYFAGLEVTLTPASQNVYPIVDMGDQTLTVAALPNNITFDRVLVHPAPCPANGVCNYAQRGITMNCVYCSTISSNVWGIVNPGEDAQAIMAYNTVGPLLIANNDLESSGENVMFNTECPNSGYGPGVWGIPGCPVPSDITITRNHLIKQAAWRTLPQGCGVGPGQPECYDVKNELEWKHGQRTLVDSNWFDTTFQEGQGEFIISNCFYNPFQVCTDYTITSNLFTHGPEIAAIVGMVGNSNTGLRMMFRNNVGIDISGVNWGGTGLSFQIQNTNGIIADHNTIINQPPLYINGLNFSDAPPSSDLNFQYTNNFNYGSPFANGMNPGGTIAALPSPVLGGDAFVGDWWPNLAPWDPPDTPAYPAGLYVVSSTVVPVAGQPACNYDNKPIAQCWPLDWALVGFVDFPGGSAGTNLAGLVLSPNSPYHNAGTDGADIGANIPAVLAAVNGIQ